MVNNFEQTSLDLNERCVAYLLTHDQRLFYDEITEKDMIFSDNPEDLNILKKYNSKQIDYGDPQFTDVITRNPFLSMNMYSITRKLIKRAIEKTDFDIKDAIISVISDPYGHGKYRKYYIGHDIGDGKQSSFVFLHELGKKIGIEGKVKDEIVAYVKEYTKFFDDFFCDSTNPRLPSVFKEQKEKEIEMYKNCLIDKFREEMRPPMLNGDYVFIDIFAHLATDEGKLDLIDYANKYYDSK